MTSAAGEVAVAEYRRWHDAMIYMAIEIVNHRVAYHVPRIMSQVMAFIVVFVASAAPLMTSRSVPLKCWRKRLLIEMSRWLVAINVGDTFRFNRYHHRPSIPSSTGPSALDYQDVSGIIRRHLRLSRRHLRNERRHARSFIEIAHGPAQSAFAATTRIAYQARAIDTIFAQADAARRPDVWRRH